MDCKHHLFFFALLMFAISGLSACGFGVDKLEWREEVLLSDDSIIVVARKLTAGSSGFPDSRRGGSIDAELTYAPAGIVWKGEFGVAREVMSFDRVDGVYYLVRYAANITACENKQPAEYGIQILKWANGQWLEIPQAEAPLDRIRMNLETNPRGHNTKDDTRGLLRLDGNDDRPRDYHARSARDDRRDPESIRAYYENSAIDERTQQRYEDDDLYHWNYRFCGYWHRQIPVSVNPTREERLKELEEAKQRIQKLEAAKQKSKSNTENAPAQEP